jgi:hypothetical protein
MAAARFSPCSWAVGLPSTSTVTRSLPRRRTVPLGSTFTDGTLFSTSPIEAPAVLASFLMSNTWRSTRLVWRSLTTFTVAEITMLDLAGWLGRVRK